MKFFRNRQYIFLALFSIVSLCVNASEELPKTQPEFLSPDEAFVMSHEIINDNHLKVIWQIHPGYYLYMGMFEFESLDNNNKIQKVDLTTSIY